MLQLNPMVKSICFAFLSLLLFPVAYILLGWGSTLANTYTLVLAPFGAAAYTASLIIAARSGQKWLLAIIAILGTMLGAFVLLICIENFIYPMPNRRWIPVVAILVLALNCVGLGAYFKARRPAERDQSDSAMAR